MKKGRKTIHHLRPKITTVVPGERVNTTGLEGTPENVKIDSTGLAQTQKKGDNEGESGDVDTGCLEGPHEDKDTAGLEGPPCDVDITGPEGPPGDVDTTSSEGPPGDVKITGKAGISDEVNIEGIPDDVDTTCTEGPQGDVDTPAVEGTSHYVDTTGTERPQGDVDTPAVEGTVDNGDTKGTEGPQSDVDTSAIRGTIDYMDTTGTEGPQSDVDTSAMEGTIDNMDTTGTEGPQSDVDTSAMEGTIDDMDTTGTEGPQGDGDTSAIEGTLDDVATTGTEGPQGDVNTSAAEGTTDDVDTTGLEKTPWKKDVDMTGLETTATSNSVETTGLDEGDVDTTGLERKPGNEDLFHTGLEEPLQKGETATFAPLDQDGLPDLWEMPDWDDTGISTKPLVFERKSFLSKSWSNTKIKEIKPKDLNCSSFEQLLAEKIPCPSMRMNNSERIRIYQESSQCSNNIDNTFRAFLCYAFPPLEISTKVAKEFRDLTYESDRFPQYTCICLSRLRNKIRVSIRCEICKIYEESCLRRGQFIKLGKSTQKEFDGISQVVAHHQSRVHQSAAMYLSGSKELDEDVSSNRGVVGDAKPLPRQRTITEALKITKPDSQSSGCLHFFENPDIVESFKDDCSIRKVSTKTLFERERAKGKFRCFLKEKGHTTCSTFKGWKDKHPREAEELAKSRPARAIYVLLNREVTYKGQKLFVKGAIKSIDPPCTGKPSGLPRHPLTCKNCFSQQQYLVDLSKKRDQSVYDASSENRIGKKGFRHDYALKNEIKEKVVELQDSNRKLGKTVSSLSAKKSKTWEEMLQESCEEKYQEKLIVDLLHLFKEDIDQTNPVQVTIIRNLVGKLRRGVNHHFVPLMKTIGKMHKIRLGETNYDLMKVCLKHGELILVPSTFTVNIYDLL